MTELSAIFTHTTPLGPLKAIEGKRDGLAFRVLFDEQTELVRQFNKKKNMIVGRKGSGKTSLLYTSRYLDDRSISIALDSNTTADIFTKIMTEINDLSQEVAFVEQVSKIWEFLFWGLVIHRLMIEREDKKLTDYLNAIGIEVNEKAISPYILIEKQLDAIRTLPPQSKPIPLKVRYHDFGGMTFLEAKSRAAEILEEENLSAYVLMDSLEDFKIDKFQHSAAIAGLLRCIGESMFDGGRCLFRCCLPAETYHEFVSISSNPLKDFSGSLLLHWDAMDLWQISARRYSKYIMEYSPNEYRTLVHGLDFSKRKDVFQFWNNVFVPEITNTTGYKESTIAYLTRHTQLLPRHIIHLLNEIISASIKHGDGCVGIGSERIVSGVTAAEDLIRKQIIEAFKVHLPEAEELCRNILPELKTRFNWSDFHRVCSRAPVKFDRNDVISQLIEIGAVGRFVEETERYNVALFEYMVPNRLVISLRDDLCIHPLFASAYNSFATYDGAKPIYAYWSQNIPDELA